MRAIARWIYIPIIGCAGWMVGWELTWINSIVVLFLVVVGDTLVEYGYTGSIYSLLERYRADNPNDA